MAAKTLAIIQARMSSSRLPGKVLLDLAGQPVLQRVVSRLSRASLLDEVLVATTTDSSDDALAQFCEEQSILCSRGSVFDVLDRYYQAAQLSKAELIVRVTADCPMIDPGEVDRVIRAFMQSDADFAANRLPPPFVRSTPIGMDTEVVTRAGLERAWKEAREAYEREHVMPYFYAVPGRFKVLLVDMDPPLGHLRFTVDTPADLEQARTIYRHFDCRDDFSLAELLEANETHPEWQAMVASVQHKGYEDVDSRIQKGNL
jgi:spore coat polysaccharide biosynthesis protein SpsF